MNDDLRRQVHDNLNLKQTGELLAIWQTNDRAAWSDMTFEEIIDILKRRGAEIPEQNRPIFEHDEQREKPNDDPFGRLELRILDEKDPPVFYNPLEVLRLNYWSEWAIKALVALNILYSLVRFPYFANFARSFFPRDPSSLFVGIIASVLVTLSAVSGVAFVYVTLKTLAYILRILMEIEFNSRKVS